MLLERYDVKKDFVKWTLRVIRESELPAPTPGSRRKHDVQLPKEMTIKYVPAH